MKFMKYIKDHIITILFIVLVLTFGFLYYIVYRTQSRVAWYNEMHTQSENMITEFKDAVGIK